MPKKECRDYFPFADVPPRKAKKMMTNPNNRQGKSPTAKKMIALAEKYSGALGGYRITSKCGRTDARTTFDEVTVQLPGKMPAEIKKLTKTADEVTKLRAGKLRLWWD